MMKYVNHPWQKNLRRIPAPVNAALRQITDGDSIIAVCTKRISDQDLKSGVYHHLQISLNNNQPSFPATILPAGNAGKYSFRNRHGWEDRRTDLPMIPKSIYVGERPIYGDWSNGSFSLWQERMVYQVDEYGPKDYSIEIDLLRRVEGAYVFKFALDCVLDREGADFEENLLFCLNILQENTGNCGIDRSEKTRDEYLATTLVDWEIFPPGSFDRFMTKIRALGATDAKAAEVIEQRVAEFRRLSPERFILGKGGFNRYIGAVLPRNIVVFENIRYGNALYVLYENWEDISQRSRSELLRGTSAEYERFPHVEGWVEQFREAVRRGRARRHK